MQARITPQKPVVATSPAESQPAMGKESGSTVARGYDSTDRIERGDTRWHVSPRDAEAKLRYGLRPDVIERRYKEKREALYRPEKPVARTPPSYFRSYAQLAEAMKALAAKYPDLVELEDVGDSAEKAEGKADRDIFRLRITNKSVPAADKHKILWLGGLHAREIANPELLMQWLDTVLAAYGTDPEATALLDGRIIDVIPMGNPDGHAVVERGYAGERGGDLWQRKNTSGSDGTDLNRNFSFGWGGPGASRWPSSDTYRGPSAASEPEVQAIEKQVRENEYKMVIDFHSYSELVLYPWGHTRERAPDYEGLKAVAEKFASFNGYTPQQSVELYPTSGTSDGTPYGEKRIPAFCVETGRSFHQSDKEFEKVKGEVWPVMTYSAQIADNPYERAKGPQLETVTVDAGTGVLLARAMTRVDAESIRGLKKRTTMSRAEYVLDPKTKPGEGVALRAVDGKMDEATEALAADISELIPGGTGRLIYVRGCDAEGNWGPLKAQWIQAPAAEAKKDAA